ncbi:nuclear divisionprotein rft1 [Gigaspora margarita]|uniref:Nuclear divisionprotein rft1 n=1 Tax=Gigaspora margarita TaxID=4874 RepID=A0A8H4EIJ2_GIGMA|nr:nuclear divisionprotein rft1 [Gigaspora margarita]
MYSQQHGNSPSHHQQTGVPRTEYHNVGRGEYPPPLEGYYPPHHPIYYDYHHPPPHYATYLPTTMNPNIPVPHSDEYQDRNSKRTKSNSADTSLSATTFEDSDKNKILSPAKNSIPVSSNSRIKFRKDRFGTFDVPAGGEEEDKRTYKLIVCQQPLRARMCGFGEKDRRPIDPPPIVQLVVNDENGNLDSSTSLSMLQNPFFVLHVTLWSEDCKEERNVISNPPKTTRVLMGSLVSSPAILKNTDGEPGCYFCFPDLSIRTEGKYTLKFSLMKLGTEDRLISTRTGIISTAFSNPFTVYSAKKFPGMTESTELSKAFAKQGLKIPIRNDVRPRKVAED